MTTSIQEKHTPLCLLRLRLDKPFTNKAPKANLLRGALSRDFDHPLMHQHQDGKLLYRYPLVQFRWDRREHQPILFGIGDGAAHLLSLPLLGHRLIFGEETRQIVEIHTDTQLAQFSRAEEKLRYHFVTPWLPFKNDQEARELDQQGLREKLAKKVVANTLITARALDVEIDWQLEADVHIRDVVSPTHKRIRRMGVFADVYMNIELPNHLGLGVAPSHGFGWLSAF